MASVPNKFYNDPALGQAFSNLAAAFAPPAGSDLAGYATAAATKQKADRLSKIFQYADNPDFTWNQADRYGVLGGLFTPNQTMESVDRNNATQRYGYDTQASSSRANNAADNTRALAANRADNARALEQTRLGNTKDIATTLLAPVPAGGTRFVPASIADMYHLPATQSGNIAAQPGEHITTPDGRTIEGAPKPLSETEWHAAQDERLRQNGGITDQMLIDAVAGERSPVQAVGPDGKTPVFMSPGAAVREGAQPYAKATGTERMDNYLAVGPDGKQKRFVGDADPMGMSTTFPPAKSSPTSSARKAPARHVCRSGQGRHVPNGDRQRGRPNQFADH